MSDEVLRDDSSRGEVIETPPQITISKPKRTTIECPNSMVPDATLGHVVYVREEKLGPKIMARLCNQFEGHKNQTSLVTYNFSLGNLSPGFNFGNAAPWLILRTKDLGVPSGLGQLAEHNFGHGHWSFAIPQGLDRLFRSHGNLGNFPLNFPGLPRALFTGVRTFPPSHSGFGFPLVPHKKGT